MFHLLSMVIARSLGSLQSQSWLRCCSALTAVVLLLTPVPLDAQPKAGDAKILLEVKGHEVFTRNSFSQNVVVHNGHAYLAWVDQKLRGRLAKISPDGHIEYVTVIPKHLEDTHNGIQVGVDKDGFIHVFGDMHHSPLHGKRPRDREHLDEVWQYWVSEKPEDISSFKFVGNTPQAPPGTRITYVHFAKDNHGELYIAYRNGIIGKGYVHGVMAGTVARYDTKRKRWNALGGTSPFEIPATVWTAQGIRKGVTGYQSYKIAMRFDRRNHLHLVWTNFGENSPRVGASGAEYLLYAKSNNGGKSWQHADGRRIRKLPITHETADVVIHAKEGESRLASIARLTFDQDGRPLVYLIQDGQAKVVRHNGRGQWGQPEPTQPRLADVTFNRFGHQFFITRGQLWQSNDRGVTFKGTRIPGLSENAAGNPTAYNKHQADHLLILDKTKDHRVRLWRIELK